MSDNDKTELHSWCETTFDENVIFNHNWRIKNFKKVDKFQRCEFVICVNERNIPVRARIYPCGFKDHTNDVSFEDYVMLGVYITQHDSVSMALETAIFDRDGKKQHIRKNSAREFKFCIFEGFILLKSDDLFGEENGLLSADGNLTISMKFTILLGDTVKSASQLNIKVFAIIKG